MSLPRHLRKKRPKPRPNSRPGRLDLTSVKLGSSALGRCHEPNWNRPLIACPERVNVDEFGHVYAKRSQFEDDMSKHTLPTAVGVVNPDLKRKQPWALA